MRLPAPTLSRRPGFTLIEVLVAAGLCMLIMAVLAAAFGAGADTFSLLKSTGEANERLKVATAIMRFDLLNPHLEAETGEAVKVSALRYDMAFPGSPDRFARPQPFGFFRISQDRIPVAPGLANPPAPFAATNNGFSVTYPEGQDPDGLPSTRGMSHTLQMAVRLPANRIDRVATTRMPKRNGPSDNPVGPGLSITEQAAVAQAAALSLGNIDSNVAGRFASQWYEVSYFLTAAPTGTTAGGLPVYALYRLVRCLLPKPVAGQAPIDWAQFNNTNTNAAASTTGAPGMSYHIGPPAIPGGPPTFPLNTIADITNPNFRTGGMFSNRGAGGLDQNDQLVPLGGATPNLTGEDILLTNVVSFEVRAAWDGNGSVRMPAFAGVPASDEFPFTDLPAVISAPPSASTPQGSGNPLFLRVDAAGNPLDAGGNPSSLPPAAGTPTLRVFDTWQNNPGWDNPVVLTNPGPPQVFGPNPNYVPLPIRLKAVQIKLRIYDPKNKLTRQITMIQDL